ncbi:MAG: hypothetical protein IJF65_07525 [Clostridia bacterium]|nr:hypothetical protein [Clostridia bacterium]
MFPPTLQALFDGRLNPMEQILHDDPLYLEACKRHIAGCDRFREKLDPALHKEFNRLMDQVVEYFDLQFTLYFIGGYRLGARMTLETLPMDTQNGQP